MHRLHVAAILALIVHGFRLVRLDRRLRAAAPLPAAAPATDVPANPEQP